MKGRWAYSRAVKCCLCGKVDEGVIIKLWIWIIPLKIEICEGCISRMLRSFRRWL